MARSAFKSRVRQAGRVVYYRDLVQEPDREPSVPRQRSTGLLPRARRVHAKPQVPADPDDALSQIFDVQEPDEGRVLEPEILPPPPRPRRTVVDDGAAERVSLDLRRRGNWERPRMTFIVFIFLLARLIICLAIVGVGLLLWFGPSVSTDLSPAAQVMDATVGCPDKNDFWRYTTLPAHDVATLTAAFPLDRGCRAIAAGTAVRIDAGSPQHDFVVCIRAASEKTPGKCLWTFAAPVKLDD